MPLVSAHVLTYRSPVALRRCLDALDRQTVPLEEVVVVDNDGGGEAGALVAEREGRFPVRVIGLDRNEGPAGGHAAGLRDFVARGSAWAWVMDDDVVADPTALESMLALAMGDPGRFVTPLCRDLDTGEEWANSNGWWGVLLSRRAVEEVGEPDSDLVWWTEDTEYLQWRLPQAGYRRVEPEGAIVGVGRGRDSPSKPGWKYYYETRNQIHYRLRVQRPPAGGEVPRHLTRRVRGWRALRSTSKLAVRAVWRERAGRGQRLAMVGRGAFDGVAGRLGRRVELVDPDRPSTPQTGSTAGAA